MKEFILILAFLFALGAIWNAPVHVAFQCFLTALLLIIAAVVTELIE